MVAPIDPSNTLVRLAALMREVSARRRPAERTKGGAARGLEGIHRTGTRDRKVAATLASRVRSIGADHPHRHAALCRVLVETLLTEEFGESVINEPAFQTIVDDVVAAMRRSPPLAADLDQIVSALLADGASDRPQPENL